MKFKLNSTPLTNAQFEKKAQTNPSHNASLDQRLQIARHLVESLDYAESPLEWQMLLQELRKVLAAPT